MKILENYSLLHHNTFGIDTRCSRFAEYASVEELQAFLQSNPAGPLLHIGGGSNLLFTGDYAGTVLHSAIYGRKIIGQPSPEETLLWVGAGEVWDELVAWCVEQGLYGLENLSLIPGEVGASAVQNIGAYGVEAADRIVQVETVCMQTGEARTFRHDECRYAYRSSIFKHELRGQYAVTAVVFRLARHFEPQLHYGGLRKEWEERGGGRLTAAALRDVIIDVRRRKLPDPAETGSAGSFFMNPVVDTATWLRIQAAYPDAPHYDVEGGIKLSAGWMIEQCGWKGRSLGRAGVYSKQALVLVNLGGATGSEVVQLAERIQADVKARFGVDITPEANYI